MIGSSLPAMTLRLGTASAIVGLDESGPLSADMVLRKLSILGLASLAIALSFSDAEAFVGGRCFCVRRLLIDGEDDFLSFATLQEYFARVASMELKLSLRRFIAWSCQYLTR